MVRTSRLADRLDIEVTGAERQLEIILYGVAAGNALRDGESLALRTFAASQLVRLRASEHDVVTFSLKDAG